MADIADDLGSTGDFEVLRRVVALADAVFCSSARMTELAEAWVPAGCRRFCIEEPTEEAIRTPRVRLTGDGMLELLWFGTSRNIVYLVPHLSEIAALAVDRPFRVTLVCHENTVARQLCEAAAEQDEGLFKIRFEEWTPQGQARALDAADIVLIPGDLSKDSALKSPNRLINTIAAGRLAVASPIPSYLPFADFALIRDRMADGIRDALAARRRRSWRRGSEPDRRCWPSATPPPRSADNGSPRFRHSMWRVREPAPRPSPPRRCTLRPPHRWCGTLSGRGGSPHRR